MSANEIELRRGLLRISLDVLLVVCLALCLAHCAAQRCPSGSDRAAFQLQITQRIGATRQHPALGLFLRRQAWPFKLVAHLALAQKANAGAAGAVAARAGPVHAALLQRGEQWLVGPGIHLRAIVSYLGDEKRGDGWDLAHGG
ncbi:hypothetical protein SDC9_83837 [bioreactor metagenome]|uniref:Uncharacterized protein n=1 Tax=bioreactor metagenome TaxID=1076179 RepID=A0A644Z8L4_9ZZZZ